MLVYMGHKALSLKIELARHNTALRESYVPHLEWSQGLSGAPGQSSQDT